MFQDLDASLAALLASELAVPGVSVSFAGPDDRFPPSGVTLPALSFFLYDIREDVARRGTTWEQERHADGTITRRRPPPRIECSYLITAWAGPKSKDAGADEHRLLGEVLKVLLRHRKIPGSYLTGELAGQSPPLPTAIIAGHQLQNLGEFWQAMGIRPRTTLSYAITISADIFGAELLAPEVTEPVVQLSQRTGAS